MSQSEFSQSLRSIVGRRNVIVDERKTKSYRTGFRSGTGTALAVVLPSTLLSLWQVLQVCVANNKIIIMQAANTGLTKGSTPSGDRYERDIVIVNTMTMSKIIVLQKGEQVISFPGATLHSLEKRLEPLNRSPHSETGSTCIGASIVGGIANNSGGALLKRGPAYTELALFAQLNVHGQLELVDHLGIDGLGESADEILINLEKERFADGNIRFTNKVASDHNYTSIVRAVDADSPSRYNGNRASLYEASGCAGKLAVFAVRLDTFPKPRKETVFYVGTNDPKQFTSLRRDMLSKFTNLPDAAEYLHRDCFDVAEYYGKDTFMLIQHLGTAFMPRLFAIKRAIDTTLNRMSWLPCNFLDHVLQFIARLCPQHLPQRLLEFRSLYEHHLILKTGDAGIAEALEYLEETFSRAGHEENSGFFVCTDDEANKVYLHRFAAAGAAIRYQIIHQREVGDVLALDVALKRNDKEWLERLPPSIQNNIVKSFYYGHFFCHVFHQDYILKKGADTAAVKDAMLKILDNRGAKYPAEHNVGHDYHAEEDLARFYRRLDPTNSFNPGVGKTSRKYMW